MWVHINFAWAKPKLQDKYLQIIHTFGLQFSSRIWWLCTKINQAVKIFATSFGFTPELIRDKIKSADVYVTTLINKLYKRFRYFRHIMKAISISAHPFGTSRYRPYRKLLNNCIANRSSYTTKNMCKSRKSLKTVIPTWDKIDTIFIYMSKAARKIIEYI